MKNPFSRFLLILSPILLVVFLTHLYFLNLEMAPLFDNKIIAAYILNYLLALGIYLLIYQLREKFRNSLGFIFMAGGFFKFVIFFLFFYGTYKRDGTIDSHEFAAFFTPYITCLIIETGALVNLLKKLGI